MCPFLSDIDNNILFLPSKKCKVEDMRRIMILQNQIAFVEGWTYWEVRYALISTFMVT